MKHPFRLFTLVFVALFHLVSLGQDATIRGFVYEQQSGEPAIFSNVYLQGTTIGAVTDVNGFFAITKLPAGPQTLVIQSLGHDTLRVPIVLEKGKMLSDRYFLRKSNITLNEVQISAQRSDAQTEVQVSSHKITAKDIQLLPAAGGEPDLAQYIQVLPGVVFTGDQGGQLYIRGGSPIQNKVLLDGMVIYNPFHSIGFFSVFDAETIRNAEVYTGGFNATYGGRISSVMDITTIDGNKRKISGNLSASPFAVKGLVEGPLGKKDSIRNGSFVFSAKTAILEETSQSLYNYIDSNGLPFHYTDLYGKLSFSGDNGSKLNLFGFSFSDQVTYQAISNLSWKNSGFGSQFVVVPDGSPLLLKGKVSYSDYTIRLNEANLTERFSKINGFNIGLDFTYFLHDDRINYGLEITGNGTDFSYFNETGRETNIAENTTQFSGYVMSKFDVGRWIFEPGLRFQYYASNAVFSPEPRLGAKYNITDRIRLKLATGLYSQNLVAASSERDVVNLFYGFVTAPDNLQDSFTDENGKTRDIQNGIQRAHHFVTGAEWEPLPNLSLQLEGYYKRFSQLTNINRNKTFEDTPENFAIPDALKKDFIVESGNAYGADLTTKFESNQWNVWCVYSLSYVDRWDGTQSYFPLFDRRHNINLLTSYAWGDQQQWEASGRWNFGTGFPFTQTVGFYEEQNFPDGIYTDYTATNQGLELELGNLNGGRLPTYHRFDVSIKRKTAIKSGLLTTTLSVTNVYDRENIFYVDRISNEVVRQLPILPSIGVKYSF